MKTQKFPFSLGACTAFQATCQHGSFRRAAEELNLTQAAVSYQVRKLERDLGTVLLRRHPRPMVPTEAGRTFLLYVDQAFDILASGSQAVSRKQSSKRRLLISVAQSFGAKWLLPRLSDIQAAAPKRHIEIDLNDEILDFAKAQADVAIRYMKPGFLDQDQTMFSAPLFATEEIFPVCDPRTAQLFDGQPADTVFKGVPLLDHRKQDVTWADWFRETGMPGVGHRAALTFSHHSTMIDAAVAGQGICLGRLPLVCDDIRAGRLVRPVGYKLISSYGYYVVCRADQAEEPAIKQLIGDLCSKAAESADGVEAPVETG